MYCWDNGDYFGNCGYQKRVHFVPGGWWRQPHDLTSAYYCASNHIPLYSYPAISIPPQFVDSRSAFFLHKWLTMNSWYIIAIFLSRGYKVVSAPVRNMGYNPINYRYIYLISPINHSYWTYVHQLQAPHGSRPPVSNKRNVFFPAQRWVLQSSSAVLRPRRSRHGDVERREVQHVKTWRGRNNHGCGPWFLSWY